MLPTRKLVVVISLVMLSGCSKPCYVVPETPMPANTVLLSQMMRELSAQPGFDEALIGKLDGKGKKGPALLTPSLVDELRKRLLGKDWQGLDRFPGWTMREINPTVRVIGHEAGKSSKLEGEAAVHPGAPVSAGMAKQYLDLGPYALDKAETVSLGEPSKLPGFTTDGLVSELGAGVVRGDGPNALAAEHAESQRLADVLNRLAVNGMDGVAQFDVDPRPFNYALGEVTTSGGVAQAIRESRLHSPDDFIGLLSHVGYSVTVTDSRYFANFAHLHYRGADVMAPFFVNSEIVVPKSGGRPLLVPVAHAELEWHVHGPLMNADVSYYFGIDGKAEWRVMDTLDQAWVLKRDAHTYTGADAVEVTRLAGLMTVAYMRLHAAYPALPFGGYYGLGVCQDGVSAVEKKMTGKVTLYPNTADLSFFNDPRDEEINGLIASIPKDREGNKPEPERIFGSLPVAPGPDVKRAFDAVTIPGLAADLNATYAAWKAGDLERTHSTWDLVRAWGFVLSAAALAVIAAVATLKVLEHGPVQRNPRR
jgi:hypothetical protein